MKKLLLIFLFLTSIAAFADAFLGSPYRRAGENIPPYYGSYQTPLACTPGNPCGVNNYDRNSKDNGWNGAYQYRSNPYQSPSMIYQPCRNCEYAY